MIFLLSLFLIVLLASLLILEKGKRKQLEDEIITLSWFNHKFPIGTKLYFDWDSGNLCKRCEKGTMLWRYRYLIVRGLKGGTSVEALTRIYWCRGCNFRGISPQPKK